jgi:hypothetical protein
MKSFVWARAPKKAANGWIPLLLGVTGSVLAMAHDAGAVPRPGAPALPNIGFSSSNLLGLPVASPLMRSTDTLANNVANAVSRLQFPQSSTPKNFTRSPNYWDGVGELPGAFKPTWEMPKSDFDPLFRTSYWDAAKGPVNSASAPWNYWASYDGNSVGTAIFDRGRSYIGTWEAPPLPVALSTEADPTASRAL